MKKLKFFNIVLLLLFANMTFGQLTTRENIDPTVLKTGTRPQMGDYGIYIGPSIFSVIDFAKTVGIYDEWAYLGIPLINAKYYNSNNTEWRLGLQLYNYKTKLKGDVSSTSAGNALEKKSETLFRLTPGIAYHFSPKNIIDVYAGAGLVFGANANSNDTKLDDDNYVYVSQNSLVGGLNAYIGLQGFVADLPISIGVEYGISTLAQWGLKYKNVVSVSGTEQTFYTTDAAGLGTQYDKLKNKEALVGSDVRLTFSYYFNK